MSKPLKTAAETATERFNLIAPIVNGDLDKGRRYDLVREIAKRAEVSERTVRRYISAWGEGGFDALKPKQGWARSDKSVGGNFDDVVEAAIALRRESPSRSVADIIKILELEETIEPGTVARSTLQRHIAAKGYTASQMRLYTSKGAAARRFRKEHRNQLWEGDVKYGIYVDDGTGRKKQIYLVVWIDDSTRYVTSARFYFDQTVGALEDSLRRGIQKFGVPEKVYTDNGPQYRSKWLNDTCAKLGIRLLRARPYHPEGKGVVERFNRTINKLLSELALENPKNLAQCNEYLEIWLETYYHSKPHSTLAGISPATAFGTDTRPLKFAPAEKLRDAFLHTETRKVDKTGCVSFNGSLYEVGLAYLGRKITIQFDPSWTEEIEVVDGQRVTIAKKLVIGPNCGVTPVLPEHMKATPPDASRMLGALKKEYHKMPRPSGVATTFAGYLNGGTQDV